MAQAAGRTLICNDSALLVVSALLVLKTSCNAIGQCAHMQTGVDVSNLCCCFYTSALVCTESADLQRDLQVCEVRKDFTNDQHAPTNLHST